MNVSNDKEWYVWMDYMPPWCWLVRPSGLVRIFHHPIVTWSPPLHPLTRHLTLGLMASNAASSLQQRLDSATRKYQDLQEELSKNVEARERLGAQQAETQGVKKGRWNLKLLQTATVLSDTTFRSSPPSRRPTQYTSWLGQFWYLKSTRRLNQMWKRD